MSPLMDADHRNTAIDMVADGVAEQPSVPPTSEMSDPDLSTVILHSLDEIKIERSTPVPQQRCQHRHNPQVFPRPVSVINMVSGREQMRYMRLLRGVATVARVLGVQPFGTTQHILINVHMAARRLQFDTPGSIPGHDTDIADRWVPTLSELTDMAMHINMRYGPHATSRCLSPIRSRTPPGGRHRPRRPDAPADTGEGKELPRVRRPHCAMRGCPCTSTFNGQPGEACCRTCRRGTPCAANYHERPLMQTGRLNRSCPQDGLTYPHCATPGCPCTSTFNGQPWEVCCRTCRQGAPCAANFHTRPFPNTDQHSSLPHMQAAATHAGHGSQLPIDLSDEADMTYNDGDMYDLHGNTPPPYAQHDYSVVTQSERVALAITDRTSVGRI